MLGAFEGRVNRRTYLIGNVIALLIMGFFAAIIVLPIAILSLAVNSDGLDSVLSYFYLLAAIPALIYFVYFFVMTVKRLHDIGRPGFMIVVGFTILLGFSRIVDIYVINLLILLILAFFFLMPGTKKKNPYGPKPVKKFKFEYLKINI